MVLRDKPAAAEYGARRRGLAASIRKFRALRERVAVLDNSLGSDILFSNRRRAGLEFGKFGHPAFSVTRV